MSPSHKGKKPENVFTPRAPDINDKMYVQRPELEQALKRGLRTNLHLLIHGESGSGKTWLYKKVLKENKFEIFIANLATASRLGSITAEFSDLINSYEEPQKTGYSEIKKGDVSAGVASASVQHQSNYKIGEMEPFEALLKHISQKSSGKPSVLVLDNLETIHSDPKLLKELADIITLIDDSRYAKYEVKILIVGVPGDLRSYYNNTPHLTTIANRIREIPEVSRMTSEQCKNLVKTGFINELGYEIEDFDEIVNHISWTTDKLPQRLHEYCLELAFLGQENGGKITKNLLDDVDRYWLQTSLSASYAIVESMMNERETKVQRRNQTLYSLGLVETEEFRVTDIEEILRKEFPESTVDLTLNISKALSYLASQNNPIIKRSPKGDAYCFSDPKYRMCLRAMLRKRDNVDKVEKISISDIS
ncbi:hypothetical protein AWQ21_05560 [Picosynechococcus sp. PCC 7003]|uniref:ATP-binding protein n=1 Tax=Picosynechococcus sp. PCC 7003 TaxID=374981 RepID=UPI000810BB18|nr:ATP-binding protein [Picosynechococcus sp. PCC 7003]ANV83895.1 hypothetical protein AWQ21_05560 [Picosynechococcus sp. PCC 7003]